MELKNIFKMTKADRYTQDGRDELAKLQETEDVKYKTGDISQKTGLQKQPDGSWAPPKGGKPAAENKPGAKKPAENHPPKVMPEGMSLAEFMKAWEDDARKHGFEKGQGYEWREYLRKEDEEGEASAKAFADRVHKGEIKYNKETGKLEESKPAETKSAIKELTPEQKKAVKTIATLSGKSEDEAYEIVKSLITPRSEEEEKAEQQRRETYKTKEIEKVKKLEGLDIETFTAKLDEMGYEFAPRENKKGEIVGGASWGTFGKNSADKPEFEYKYSKEKGIHDVTIRDAAPRVLTGDTRIRVRKA